MKNKEEKITVAKARAKFIRVSPRKVRLVIDLIRGEKIGPALAILANLNKKAKICVEKLLRSAISNAKQNPAINTNELFIAKITADGGPALKRYRAAAMGRATMIRHRTTHLTIELCSHREQKTESRKQKSGVRKQKTEVRKQKSSKIKRKK